MSVARISILLCLLLAACSNGPAAPKSANLVPPAEPATVFVVSNGWHSAVVLPRGAIPAVSVTETADFPDARFLEFGWGDAEYFPDPEPGVGTALRAGLLPTPAVMHVVPLARDPAAIYPRAEIVAFDLDEERLGRLAAFIGASFDRSGGRASGPGLYPDSRFYPATGRFHLGNTCNSWTARALAFAGLAVDETDAARAADLMAQLRPRGRLVSKPLK